MLKGIDLSLSKSKYALRLARRISASW